MVERSGTWARRTQVSIRVLMPCIAVLTVLAVTGCGAERKTNSPRTAPGAASPAPTMSVPVPTPEAGTTGSPAAGGSLPPPPPGVTPAPVLTTKLIVFRQVPAAAGDVATEVTTEDKFGTLLPAGDAQQVRDMVARNRAPGVRLFAFVLTGCQNTGATMSIVGVRVTAMLTGGENVACFAPEYFLAVFTVPSAQVPPGARLGPGTGGY